MDQSGLGFIEHDDTPIIKTIKGATLGLAGGAIWGMIVALWNDAPRVEKNVPYPVLLRTLNVCGKYGPTFAALGGIYIGVEQLVQQERMKRDFVNGAVGAFVAGASVFGYKRGSISSAVKAGTALAATSAMLDVGGQTTRVDTGKEYYPYATEKQQPPAN